MSLTLYITVITVAISLIAMYNEALMDKLIFNILDVILIRKK